MPAWRTRAGIVSIGKELPNSTKLLLPCSSCLGCRTSAALGWALRGLLELQDHRHAVFTTLTFNAENLPPTLSTRTLRLFHKRLRKAAGPIRHLSSGEYGEQNYRPHYHSIIYGLSQNDAKAIDKAWGFGHTQTVEASPASIAYTAGYTSKKLDDYKLTSEWRVNYDTGEEYKWKAPFLQMSRRPGIGSSARQYTESWREYAILNGMKIPVPRYLHNAWKATATEEQLAELAEQKSSKAFAKVVKQIHDRDFRPLSERLRAAEASLQTKQKLKASRRNL